MNIKEITSYEVEQTLKKNSEALVVIDVREEDELHQGMIPHAYHIPLQQIPFSLDQLNKQKHYVIVCRSGHRSMLAASYLNEHGYDAINLRGGMLEWKGRLEFA
ncbi:rhodanese-like domain-containing protein [Virgibacillus sp. W0181]|uniref:rhodanese-like domain-containing protein n=1 Tax=Virgibacillus sp. W0181 TaxID=3391581 RepID=UPI003F48D13B